MGYTGRNTYETPNSLKHNVCSLIYVGIILGLKLILKNKPSMVRHACNTVRDGAETGQSRG